LTEAGLRAEPDVTDMHDDAGAIALQMERLITDIGGFGTMIEQATQALDDPIDTNIEYRDRQRQMYCDYQAAWDSAGRDSHRAFLRMINDPDQRAEFETDVATVASALPGGDQCFLITRDEMHGMSTGVLNETDRGAVTFTARIDAAIARLTGLDILRRGRDDEDGYTVSPVITAVMTASVITELQQQFEQLTGTGGSDRGDKSDD
jgi:hypothetical protein